MCLRGLYEYVLYEWGTSIHVSSIHVLLFLWEYQYMCRKVPPEHPVSRERPILILQPGKGKSYGRVRQSLYGVRTLVYKVTLSRFLCGARVRSKVNWVRIDSTMCSMCTGFVSYNLQTGDYLHNMTMKGLGGGALSRYFTVLRSTCNYDGRVLYRYQPLSAWKNEGPACCFWANVDSHRFLSVWSVWSSFC